MQAYIIRRLLMLISTLFGITLLTFVIIRMAPGDPVKLNQAGVASEETSQQVIAQMKKAYGLDDNYVVGYIKWVRKIAAFDFGNSFLDHRPVWHKIRERIHHTAYVNIVSLILAYLIAFPAGIYAAVYRNSLYDKVSGLLFFALYSVPNFWLALLLQRWLSVDLGLFPTIGMYSTDHETMTATGKMFDYMHHSVLIVTCSTLTGFAFFSRFIRSNMLEVTRQDYIRTARAKGLAPQVVIFKHAFRNILIPVITILATLLPSLIGGSVVLEYIFNWRGMGQLFIDAIFSRDYPVIMALTFITSLLTLVSLLLADLLYAVADPRVSLS